MSTPAPRLSLTPADFDLERRKQMAHSLILSAQRGLDAMRAILEPGSGAGALEALTQRDVALAALLDLDALLRSNDESKSLCSTKRESSGILPRWITAFRTRPATLRAPGFTDWTDQESLQRFRRAALSDLEHLGRVLEKRLTRDWCTNADENRQRAVRRACLRWGAGLGLAAVLLAVWWGWQRSREEAALVQVTHARTKVAAQGVKLISLAGWLAQKTQGKPLSAFAQDMYGTCAGIDIQKTFPNHPCREAWVLNRRALFRGVIPEPGKPVDAPSQIFSDPWGAPYVLLIPETDTPRPPRVVSAGPDGFIGTPDDVSADIPYWNPNQPN